MSLIPVTLQFANGRRRVSFTLDDAEPRLTKRVKIGRGLELRVFHRTEMRHKDRVVYVEVRPLTCREAAERFRFWAWQLGNAPKDKAKKLDYQVRAELLDHFGETAVPESLIAAWPGLDRR